MQIRKILVPTDFSANAEHAYTYANELATKFGASIVLLFVTEPIYYPVGPGQVGIGWDGLYSEITEQADKQLAQAKTKFHGVDVAVRRCDGSPFREILQAAESECADLIVIATHGHTGLKHLFIGSTAEKVVRESPCPVLTVRPDADGAHES